MFPRGVITPASPAAPSRDEARALLAPEEERLLESNVSAKRTGALTWTLRGLGAVAVVSGVVAVASIAGPGRDAASAVLSRLGSSQVLGRAPAVATVVPEPLPAVKDEYSRQHAHEARYRNAKARASVPSKKKRGDADSKSEDTDPSDDASNAEAPEETDPSDVQTVSKTGESPRGVKRVSSNVLSEELSAKDQEIETLKMQLRRQAEELDRRREMQRERERAQRRAAARPNQKHREEPVDSMSICYCWNTCIILK